jgi:hypothetical protein
MDAGETRQGVGRQGQMEFLCNSQPKKLEMT